MAEIPVMQGIDGIKPGFAYQHQDWIMSDDERSQLTQLAQRIAARNKLSASVSMTYDYMSISFTKLTDE